MFQIVNIKGADQTEWMCRLVFSRVEAHIMRFLSYLLHCCTLPNKRCLSHCMCLDDVALFE